MERLLMRKKMPLVIIGILILIIGVGINYYINHFDNKVILYNITNKRGYSLDIHKERIEIEVFIKPEWIPFDSDEPMNLNVKLCEKNNTDVILTQVWNRGDDIYFFFDTSYHLNYKNGEFLYNGFFNEDGTYNSNSNINDFWVYDLGKESINIGQRGFGPNSAFSFGIGPDEYNKIRNGFYMKYSGLILYSYSLND
jgi:hypothetical protein